MSDLIDGWLGSTHANVFGGHDFFGADGITPAAHSTLGPDGVEHLYATDGHVLGHVRPTLDGGHELLNPDGMHVGAALPDPVGHGTTLRDAAGFDVGHVHPTATGFEVTDPLGGINAWQANLFGGFTADPLTNMNHLVFPHLL